VLLAAYCAAKSRRRPTRSWTTTPSPLGCSALSGFDFDSWFSIVLGLRFGVCQLGVRQNNRTLIEWTTVIPVSVALHDFDMLFPLAAPQYQVGLACDVKMRHAERIKPVFPFGMRPDCLHVFIHVEPLSATSYKMEDFERIPRLDFPPVFISNDGTQQRTRANPYTVRRAWLADCFSVSLHGKGFRCSTGAAHSRRFSVSGSSSSSSAHLFTRSRKHPAHSVGNLPNLIKHMTLYGISSESWHSRHREPVVSVNVEADPALSLSVVISYLSLMFKIQVSSFATTGLVVRCSLAR